MSSHMAPSGKDDLHEDAHHGQKEGLKAAQRSKGARSDEDHQIPGASEFIRPARKNPQTIGGPFDGATPSMPCQLEPHYNHKDRGNSFVGQTFGDDNI